MISRIWHGWTSLENADAYERLRREQPTETEFITIMWFSSLEAVRVFAGSDYEAAVVPPAARALLTRFDARSAHYDVKERRVT
jgi:hypothetical protein